jgi:anti-sigma-K factor RskA
MAMTPDPEGQMDEIEALLPWYAAGTLDARDAKRVDEALADRPDLAASLALIKEDRDETIALNERLGAPSGAAWARVLATAKIEPRKIGLFARLGAVLGLGAGGNPTRLAWAAAAAAVVILLQAAAIVALLPDSRGASYRTASEAPPKAEGANVIVAFAPDARLEEVGAWLKEHDASIVEGPRGGGMYRLRVGDKVLKPDEMAALLAELGKAPVVRAVLPAN